jgi:tetratricopeptide (TPR) repeat protein
VQQFRDDRDAALASYEEALKLFRQVGAKLGEANVLSALCRMSVKEGDIESAEKQLSTIIQTRRMIGDLYSEGADYGNFSMVLLENGYNEKAKEYAQRARPIFEKINLPAIVEMMDQIIVACDDKGEEG